ncbi:MAG: HlyD family secretion protein [Acidobacteriota bacterium]|jgi:membrane fusion protein (multidrug efflux system)|nr:HlyD family secretion protein [Acidobacteriota bacterium]
MATNSEDQEFTPSRGGNGKKVALIGVVVVLLILGVGYYVRSRGYEETDNAFIDGNVIQISPRISGQVVKVHVRDNQHVSQGELIAEIDPGDYETSLHQAQAAMDATGARVSGAESGLELTSSVTQAVLVQAGAALEAAHDQVLVLAARLKQDESAVAAAAAGLEQAEAGRMAAEAESLRAKADADRYRELYKKDEVSKQIADRADADARSLAARLDAAKQAVAAAGAGLEQAKSGLIASRASLSLAEKQVRQAEGRFQEAQSAPQQIRVRQSDLLSASAQKAQQLAAVQQAELNHSYTKIFAPDSGYITKKSVEPGNFVQPGQALMALVSDRLWVVANFKETQLERMRPGQPVAIHVDAYPQLDLRGRVDSIQSGSGARFSLLPPENATGNYVKVVQRVPVKILIDQLPPEEYRLGPGLSVVPEVNVR